MSRSRDRSVGKRIRPSGKDRFFWGYSSCGYLTNGSELRFHLLVICRDRHSAWESVAVISARSLGTRVGPPGYGRMWIFGFSRIMRIRCLVLHLTLCSAGKLPGLHDELSWRTIRARVEEIETFLCQGHGTGRTRVTISRDRDKIQRRAIARSARHSVGIA